MIRRILPSWLSSKDPITHESLNESKASVECKAPSTTKQTNVGSVAKITRRVHPLNELDKKAVAMLGGALTKVEPAASRQIRITNGIKIFAFLSMSGAVVCYWIASKYSEQATEYLSGILSNVNNPEWECANCIYGHIDQIKIVRQCLLAWSDLRFDFKCSETFYNSFDQHYYIPYMLYTVESAILGLLSMGTLWSMRDWANTISDYCCFAKKHKPNADEIKQVEAIMLSNGIRPATIATIYDNSELVVNHYKQLSLKKEALQKRISEYETLDNWRDHCSNCLNPFLNPYLQAIIFDYAIQYPEHSLRITFLSCFLAQHHLDERMPSNQRIHTGQFFARLRLQPVYLGNSTQDDKKRLTENEVLTKIMAFAGITTSRN